MSGKDRENIKWRLEIFEKFVLDVREGFDADRERYRALAQSIEEDFATWRNTVLVFVPFGVSIILAMSPSGLNYLSKEYAFGLLLLWLGGGLTVFVLFYTSKKRIHDYIREMDASFFLGKGKPSFFRGYALSQAFLKLDKMDEGRIDFYYQYTSVAAGAIELELINKFEKMLKYRSVVLRRKPFLRIKKELDDGIRTRTGEVDAAERVYLERIGVWGDLYKEDLEVFNMFFKNFIEYTLEQNKTSLDNDSPQQHNK